MKVSIVTTMYYSENYLLEFYDRSKASVNDLGLDYEFIFVDDGSPDKSLLTVLKLQTSDSKIKVVESKKENTINDKEKDKKPADKILEKK